MLSTNPGLDRAHVLDLLAHMIRIRRFEDKCAELYTRQKIRGFLHLYDGEEAIAAGVIPVLKDTDRIVATYREHGHALARGVPMASVMAEMYGKANGCSGGRGGSMHIFDAATNFYGGNAIVGGGLPLAGGLALADRMRGEANVTACFFGEGAVAEGEFHETMNLAELWDLPVLFVCENNLYAMGSALARTESQTDIFEKAAAYGIEAERVDGMDVVAVEAAARRAIGRIRETGRPHFLECATYRFRAHSMFDAQLYRDKDEVAEWRGKGPIVRFQGWLLENGLIHQSDVDEIETRVAAEIAEAVDAAEAGAWEPVETLTHHVLGPQPEPPAPAEPSGKMVETTYREAVKQAICDAMERDDRVFLMGEDVGAYGGCYAVIEGSDGPVRRGPHPRHPAQRVGLHRRGHRCCGGRAAAHRGADDGQFQPAGARPDHEHGRHDPAHVGRAVRRATGDPHGHRRGQAACRAAFPQPRGLVCAYTRPQGAGARDAGGCPRDALDRPSGSRPGADLRERHALQHERADRRECGASGHHQGRDPARGART